MALRNALLQIARDQRATVGVKGNGVGFFACKEDEQQDDGNGEKLCAKQNGYFDFFSPG